MSQTIFSEEDIKNRHITPSPAAIFAPHQRLIKTPLLYIHSERSDVCKKPPTPQDAPASAAGEGWGGGSNLCVVSEVD